MKSTPQLRGDADPTATSPPPTDRTTLLAGLVSASLAGLLWGLAHASETSFVLPWVGLVPWLAWISLRARHPGGGLAVLGFSWLSGALSWIVQMPWIGHTLRNFGDMPAVVAVALLVLLCLYLGLYHVASGWLFWRLCRGRDSRPVHPGLIVLGTGSAWVALEWIRAWMISGFPWNLAAYSAVDVPGVLEVTAWIGSYGVSAVVVAINAALALAMTGRGLRVPVATTVATVVLLVVASISQRWIPDSPVLVDPQRVLIVQPNVSIFDEPTAAEIQEGYNRLLQLSRCHEPGTLIVWPESAAWPLSWERDRRLRRDISELLASGCWLLLNSTTSERGDDQTEFYNSGLLVSPTGEVQRYDKNHLVPFGEYVPYANLLPIEQLARNAGSYTAGSEPTLLELRPLTTQVESPGGVLSLGLSICFEIVFPGEVAERVTRGADSLVTITNDAWYGDSSAPRQHLRAARFRAAELHRTVIRAAITGISAVIDPDGNVVESLELGKAGVIDTEVSGESVRTLYSRWPGAVPAACWLVTAFVLATALGADRGKLRARNGGDP